MKPFLIASALVALISGALLSPPLPWYAHARAPASGQLAPANGYCCLPSQVAKWEKLLPVLRLTSVEMVNPSVGWAEDRTRIFHTVDAGHQWINVSPPRFSGTENMTSLVPTNAYGAWLISQATVTTVRVSRTENGGRTWHQTMVTVSGRNEAPAGYSSIIPYGAESAWLTAISAGNHPSVQHLFATNDGGRSWSSVATDLPVSAIIARLTPQTGIGIRGGGGAASSMLYRTSDGGRSWKRTSLMIPKRLASTTLQITRPAFRNNRCGVLPVQVFYVTTNRNAVLIVSRTCDGGLHWKPGTAISLGDSIPDASISFAPDSTHGWALVGSRFYETANAGLQWKRLHVGIRLPSGLVTVERVSPRTGFLFARPKSARKFTRLYKSTDEGRTWVSWVPLLSVHG